MDTIQCLRDAAEVYEQSALYVRALLLALLASWLTPGSAQALFATGRELDTVAARSGGSDVFLVADDTSVKHYWRADKRARWSGFEQLDGMGYDVAAVDIGAGNFEVFVVGLDYEVWSSRRLGPALWTGFHQLHFPAKQVAVTKTSTGRFELFVIGKDNALWRSVRQGVEGTWSPWQSLGGVATRLAVAPAADGSVRVFVVGGDGAVWTTDSRRASWQSLGGRVSDVTVGRMPDGRLMLYAIGLSNSVWQRPALDAAVSFGPWQLLSGTATRLATAASSAQDLFALAASLTELEHSAGRWRVPAEDHLPLEATFVASATMQIPSLDVTQTKQLRIGVRFSADRKRVQVTSFPPFTTHAFDTPLGQSRTTVSLKSGGSGSFDPATGRLSLPVTLHLDQSLDVPFVQEDADVVLTLTTDGARGVPVAYGSETLRLALAADSRLVASGLSPLDRKPCNVTISGWFPFSAELLRGPKL